MKLSLVKNKDLNIDSEGNVSIPNIANTINWQRSKKRLGSAKTKQMSEISGTTAKPYKQKGTGNARQGSKRSVQFVGGRTCFGPVPRSFSFNIPKKIVKKAIIDTIKLKIEKKEFYRVDNFQESSVDKIKTSTVVNNMKSYNFKKVLFLYSNEDNNSEQFIKSVRNIKNYKSLEVSFLNVFDFLKYDNIIINSNSFEKLKSIIS